MKKTHLLLIFLLGFACNPQQEKEVDDSKSRKEAPLRGVVKMKIEGLPKGFEVRDYTLSEDGKMAFTTLQLPNGKRSFILKIDIENKMPVLADFSGEYNDLEPMFSPDNRLLLFASDRPLSAEDSTKDYNLWYCEIENGKTGKALPFDSIINSPKDEFYPSMNRHGDIYFTAIYEGRKRDDIYVSVKNDSTGNYEPPVMLDFCRNGDLYEFNSWIDPQDSLIIYSSYGRAGEVGGGDLYYSIKKSGEWGQPLLVENSVNTPGLDFSPFVKGDTLFFTSQRQHISWDTKSFEYLAEITKYADSNAIGKQGIYYTLFHPGK